MADKMKVTSHRFLPTRGVKPGDVFEVSKAEAAELFANGMIADPKIEGAKGPLTFQGMVSPGAPEGFREAPAKIAHYDAPAAPPARDDDDGSVHVSDRRRRTTRGA